MVGKIIDDGNKIYLILKMYLVAGTVKAIELTESKVVVLYYTYGEVGGEIDWEDASVRLPVDEEFIEEFQDKVYWRWLSRSNHTWSRKFLEKFATHLHRERF